MGSSTPEASEPGRQSATVCALCRQRKTKCDRKLPRCGFCGKAKVACQYGVGKGKKRGLRAGYVAELEARLDVLEREGREVARLERVAGPMPHGVNSVTRSVVDAEALAGNAEPLIFADRSEVISDLSSLPLSLLQNLVEVWFKECQPWCPLLHRDVLQAKFAELSTPVERIDDIVLRAVLALTISYSTPAIVLGYRGRHRLSRHLRSEVVVEALASHSLAALQALLIIVILDYGSDEIPSAWNLLSVCQRMCEQGGFFGNLSAQIQQQGSANIMVSAPSQEDLEGEQLAMSLTWICLASDSACTLGVKWREPSSLIENLSSIATAGMPDFLDPFRTHTHLLAIGFQPVHTFLYNQEHRRYIQDEDAVLAECDEMYQNLKTYTHFQPPSSYTLLPDGSIDFNPNSVLTIMHANAAILLLYQSHVNPTADLLSESIATQRCQLACEEIIETVRTVSDADIELNCPLLAARIFVAARFQLALCHATSQPRSPVFDVLMHGLDMCSRRWVWARRLDVVLRAAVLEIDTTTVTGLPAEFWDLQKTALDIDDKLKSWVGRHQQNLLVNSLSGPYV